jgi:hypothetical protein
VDGFVVGQDVVVNEGNEVEVRNVEDDVDPRDSSLDMGDDDDVVSEEHIADVVAGVVGGPDVVVNDDNGDVERIGVGGEARDDDREGMMGIMRSVYNDDTERRGILKSFAPDPSMVYQHGAYIPCKEVPCKAVFLGQPCHVGMMLPTGGTIYKGHQ